MFSKLKLFVIIMMMMMIIIDFYRLFFFVGFVLFFSFQKVGVLLID